MMKNGIKLYGRTGVLPSVAFLLRAKCPNPETHGSDQESAFSKHRAYSKSKSKRQGARMCKHNSARSSTNPSLLAHRLTNTMGAPAFEMTKCGEFPI